MKTTLSHRFVLPLCFLGLQIVASAQSATTSSRTWHVYFSPRGEATSAIRQALDNAKSGEV